MSDDEQKSKVKDTIDAARGLVEAVPIYQDALQPAAKELGETLVTVVKAVKVALAPISILVWGYEKIEEFVSQRVAEKLKNVPPGNIVTPNPAVIGPALDALRYIGNDETLRELFANLIATSLDKDTTRKAHPSFVEIIRNLSPDEARLLRLFAINSSWPTINLQAKKRDAINFKLLFKNFSLLGKEAGCEHNDLTPNYLDNLMRLGLISVLDDTYLSDSSVYESLYESKIVEMYQNQLDSDPDYELHIEKGVARINGFGWQFCQACVVEKRPPESQ